MVYGYNTDTKVQPSQWLSKGSPYPKKARQSQSNIKLMLTVIFDSEGIVQHEFLSQHEIVNKEYYLELIKHLHTAIRKKGSMLGGKPMDAPC